MRASNKVLINCANLHAGGGVGVATSFIDSLSKLETHKRLSITLLLSSEVYNNLTALKTNLSCFSDVQVVDYYGISSAWRGLHKKIREFDLTFTVFGPAYTLFSNARHLVGFAQPNIIYPSNLYSQALPVHRRLVMRLKYFLQASFFTRSGALVVEAHHVKKALKASWLFKNHNIYVVSSAVHTIYNEPAKWSRVKFPAEQKRLKLGLISRNYPHKNLKILPQLKQVLLDKYQLEADIFVTFSEEEWRLCSDVFRSNVYNVGSLKINECPSFYSSLDAVVFPSVLECFSAVPIEAMSMKVPLFASDLPFIRELCADKCNYFDPADPVSAADVIYRYFMLADSAKTAFLARAFEFSQQIPGPDERAENYMRIIENMLSDNLNCI